MAGLVLCLAAGRWRRRGGDRVTVDGFHAMAVMTGDADWQKAWKEVPPEDAVALPEVTALKVGDRAWMVTAFANPEVRDGAIDIRCDLKIVRPDGTESSIPESPCAKGALEGDAAALHLTGMLIEMSAEPGDARGTWRAEIGITDANRGVRVPLVLQYELVDGEGAE
ncbi:MAG: hypothetical protein R3D61_14285 [Defluviimonas denitrificans]